MDKTSLESFNRQEFPWHGKLILYAVLAFFITVPTCTVIVGFDDADVISAESKAEVEIAKFRSALQKQQTEAIERLIKDYKFGPVSARCAIVGWNGKAERNLCHRANEAYEETQRRK